MVYLTAGRVWLPDGWPVAEPPVVHHMCLEHADYHELNDECMLAMRSFADQLPEHTPEGAHRDMYQAAVERRMLDKHIRQYQTPAPERIST